MYEVNFGQISNRETWAFTVHVTDEDGNDADISSATASFALRNVKGGPETTQDAEASVGSGITISSPNLMVQIEETTMDNLDPGQYDCGLTVTISDFTTQLFKGRVHIVDGIVD